MIPSSLVPNLIPSLQNKYLKPQNMHTHFDEL